LKVNAHNPGDSPSSSTSEIKLEVWRMRLSDQCGLVKLVEGWRVRKVLKKLDNKFIHIETEK